MRKLIVLAAVLALSASVLAGCSPGEPVDNSPRTQEPAPATQLPTETPVLPTASPTPTATDAPPRTGVATPEPEPTLAEPPTESEQGPAPARELHLTIVYDNTAYDPGLTSDWGFAAWIEYGGHTLLFDTGGQGHVLLDNLAKLGLDPQQIEIVVLSHSHGDHTGGLPDLLDTGIRPTVYVPAAFVRSYKDTIQAQTELVEVKDPVEILPGLHSTGQLLRSVVEQGLVVETADGMVVITGCAHPGVLRMVKRATEIVDSEIALVVGGFHMGDYTQRQIEDTIAGFRELGVRWVTPTHCTGDRAQAAFRETYGEDYIEGGVGKTFAIGAGQGPGTALEAPSADAGLLLASVGFHPVRRRVLIPHFQHSRVEVRPLP